MRDRYASQFGYDAFDSDVFNEFIVEKLPTWDLAEDYAPPSLAPGRRVETNSQVQSRQFERLPWTGVAMTLPP